MLVDMVRVCGEAISKWHDAAKRTARRSNLNRVRRRMSSPRPSSGDVHHQPVDRNIEAAFAA